MKQEPPENELIDAWLYGQPDRTVRKALARELTGNPCVVSALVDQARAEASLRTRLAPASLAAAARTAVEARRPAGKRWLVAACVAGAAVAIVLVFIMTGHQPGAATVPKMAVSRLQTRPPATAASTGAKSSAPSPLAVRENLEGFLNRYWLNGKRRSFMKLSSATVELCRSIRQANTRQRPELAALSIEVQVQPPQGMDDPDVFFTDKYVTAGASLRSLAAQAGAKVTFQSEKIVLTLSPPSLPVKETMVLRTYRMSPDFLTLFAEMDRESEGEPVTGVGAKTEAGDMLVRFTRLQRGEGSAINYDAQTGRMAMRLTPSDHERVRTSLEALNAGESSTLVRIECKLMELPSGAEVKERILSQEDANVLVTELLASPEVNVLSMPAVLVRNGTSCGIHSNLAVEVPDGAGGALEDFSGWKIDLTPELQGEGLVANGTADVGTLKKDGLVQHGALDITATMAAGEVALLRFPEESPGKQMIGMLSFAAVVSESPPTLSTEPVPSETETGEPPPEDPFAK